MATSYTIHINEYQRLALITALEIANAYTLQHYRYQLLRDPTSGPPGNQEHPLHHWVEMLKELPDIEQEHPGILHGFCL